MSSPVAPRISRLGRRRDTSPVAEPTSESAAPETAEETPQQRLRRTATIIAISLIASALASGAATVIVRRARARRASLPPAHAPHATW